MSEHARGRKGGKLRYGKATESARGRKCGNWQAGILPELARGRKDEKLPPAGPESARG